MPSSLSKPAGGAGLTAAPVALELRRQNWLKRVLPQSISAARCC